MLTILVILIVLNVVVFIAKSSGAGLTVLRGVPAKPAPEHCGDARRAIVYYQRQVNRWRSKMGADVRRVRRGADPTRRLSCPRLRHLAAVWHNRATAARTAYRRWWRYQYAWWLWMPDKWQRIGACETGYGRRPGNFRWNSGTYQGFVGFYYGTWDAYRGSFPSEAYNATPRQQMIVAERVRADHGYGAWGCGGA